MITPKNNKIGEFLARGLLLRVTLKSKDSFKSKEPFKSNKSKRLSKSKEPFLHRSPFKVIKMTQKNKNFSSSLRDFFSQFLKIEKSK